MMASLSASERLHCQVLAKWSLDELEAVVAAKKSLASSGYNGGGGLACTRC